MKKNLYFRSVLERENHFQTWLLSIFDTFASPARLFLEVFIRKDFGERYFRLPYALYLAFTFFMIPILIVKVKVLMALFTLQRKGFRLNGAYNGDYEAPSVISQLIPYYIAWYIFLIAFVALCILHSRAQKRNPSVFDFSKYSRYSGNVHPIFYKIKIPGITTDKRLVECVLEPAPFFIAGILLWMIGQTLGILLILASLCYGITYTKDYINGDNFVMDRIDEMITNQELENVFVEDMPSSEARGFEFRGDKPDNIDMRRKLLPLMTDDEEIAVAR